MDGVTILNSFEVVTKTVFSWPAFWAGVIIGAVISLICAIIFGIIEGEWSAFFFELLFFTLLISPFIGLLSGKVICPEEVDWETRYEVSINEEVNMQEFMDKYEIIETRGSIYTVREKYSK